MYGKSAAADFWPKGLKALRQKILEPGNGPRELPPGKTPKRVSRGYINSQVQIIKGMFKWGVSEELVPNATYTALCTVEGLRKGRTEARETAPIGPVPMKWSTPRSTCRHRGRYGAFSAAYRLPAGRGLPASGRSTWTDREKSGNTGRQRIRPNITIKSG